MRTQGGGDAVLSSPNAHVMARQASQQHSVRRPANPAAGVAAAALGANGQKPAPAEAGPSPAVLYEEQQVLITTMMPEARH